MYVEERMYTLKVGTAPEYLKHYQNEGMKVQLKHLPHMVGYYFTEVGTLNMIVHLWGYESLDQRDKCRASMSADPEWQSFLCHQDPAAHGAAGDPHHENHPLLRPPAQ